MFGPPNPSGGQPNPLGAQPQGGFAFRPTTAASGATPAGSGFTFGGSGTTTATTQQGTKNMLISLLYKGTYIRNLSIIIERIIL